jgi:uncharacterized phiE125 gp8 family phage protein
MPLSLVTPPATEPLSLDDAKLHLQVDGDAENVTIDALVYAAREWLENFTGRALIQQTWDLKLDSFADCDYFREGAIWLPKPPVTAVSSVTYVDTAGVSQTWSSSEYQTDLPSGPHARRARIQPAYGYTWPTTRDQPNAVTIRFVAGYGTTAESVPSLLVTAMKLLIGQWFQHRASDEAATVPGWVRSMCWAYKAF